MVDLGRRGGEGYVPEPHKSQESREGGVRGGVGPGRTGEGQERRALAGMPRAHKHTVKAHGDVAAPLPPPAGDWCAPRDPSTSGRAAERPGSQTASSLSPSHTPNSSRGHPALNSASPLLPTPALPPPPPPPSPPRDRTPTPRPLRTPSPNPPPPPLTLWRPGRTRRRT